MAVESFLPADTRGELVYAGDVRNDIPVPECSRLCMDSPYRTDGCGSGGYAGTCLRLAAVCGISVYKDGGSGNGGRLCAAVLYAGRQPESFGQRRAAGIHGLAENGDSVHRHPVSASWKLDPFPCLWHDYHHGIRTVAGPRTGCKKGPGSEEVSSPGLHALHAGFWDGTGKYSAGKCTGLYTGESGGTLSGI